MKNTTRVPSEVTIRLRASFTPWYRAVIYLLSLAAGSGLWVLGTSNPASFGWAAKVAWIPFVAVAIIVLHWQRQALRAHVSGNSRT